MNRRNDLLHAVPHKSATQSQPPSNTHKRIWQQREAKANGFYAFMCGTIFSCARVRVRLFPAFRWIVHSLILVYLFLFTFYSVVLLPIVKFTQIGYMIVSFFSRIFDWVDQYGEMANKMLVAKTTRVIMFECLVFFYLCIQVFQFGFAAGVHFFWNTVGFVMEHLGDWNPFPVQIPCSHFAQSMNENK